MTYHEPPDIRTGKAPRHQDASINKSRIKSIKPLNGKIFTFENIEETEEQLRKGLKFPFVAIKHSTLGGKERASILVAISKDPKSEWINGIFENSRSAKIHIENDGTTEQFSGWKLKMRKFKGKDISHIMTKINAIKENQP